MGHNPAQRGHSRAPLLAIALAVSMALTAQPATADGDTQDTASVDSLWNQPEGMPVDSGWYFIQAWWDQAALAINRDPTQRGLAELAQANADLLNTYSLLAEARTDPGPHPVALVDPLLSSAYATITGVRVKAPLGSVFAWLNQSMLNVEGRGSTEDIAYRLLRQCGQRQQAAAGDLPQSPDLDGVWAANSLREQAMLEKLQTLASEGPDATALTAVIADLDQQRQDLLKNRSGKKAAPHAHGNGQQQGKNP